MVKTAEEKKKARREKSERPCSFCGLTNDRVKKVIAGPGVYICDECVVLCMDILEESGIDTAQCYQDYLDKLRNYRVERVKRFAALLRQEA